MPQQPGWGQQPGGMPPQQPGWGQQPGGMPQQPGWGQQPAWAPPAPSSQSSSRRPFLVILLIVLLLGLGGLVYWQFGDQLLGFVKSVISGGGTTTTADTTAPVITDVSATDISTTKATIRWTTDDLSSSQVQYGTTEAYGSVMPAQPDTDPSTGNYLGVVEHTVDLTGLQLGTTYHYKVKSKNVDGLEGVSPDKTFITTSAEE